jgi:glycosyltransferase involved in cell wall biosynthesis
MAQVDVIVPLYNKAATIERAIDSIQRQSLTDWRAIVVNDGSTDESPALVQRLGDERITLIHQKNQGPGAARNTGLRHATAPFVAFLDADDEYYRDHLANALAALGESDVPLVAAMYIEWPKATDMTAVWARRGIRPGRYELQHDTPAQLAENLCFFFHVGNSLLRREIALAYDGFYDQHRCSYGEDSTFFIRILMNHPCRILAPLALCHHREDSSLSHNFEHPVPPFLEDPDVLLRYCPDHIRDLMQRVIARMALRTAHHWARNGQGKIAADLLQRFPRTRDWPAYRFRCRLEVALSPILPYWVRIKRTVGPPTRSAANRLARKLRLLPPLPATRENRPS